MKYAVIATGGKQYKVAEGDVLEVDSLNLTPDDTYTFPEVLMVVDGATKTIGTPMVTGAKVTAKVIGQKKGEKIRVAKFKAKARYRRVTGFRAILTALTIESISAK